MKSLLSLSLVLACVVVNAQEINEEIFAKNVELLYGSAANLFKDIKTESIGNTESGEAKFGSSRKLSGADDTYIKVDEEGSQTYVAYFHAEDMDAAKAMMEKMIALTLAQVSDDGFTRKSGTNLDYESYKKHTVEFDSDNINLTGRRPSFSWGIVKGTEPPVIEMHINEPLWK